MAESADGGTEKRSMRTVLGMEDEGVSTSDVFEVVVKDHGMKAGLQYDSVCITPVSSSACEEAPEKTLQVMYTPEVENGLNYATVAVFETPKAVTNQDTVSKIVHLRNHDSDSFAVEAKWHSVRGAFASDPEAIEDYRYGSSAAAAATGASSDGPQERKVVAGGETRQEVQRSPKAAGASNVEESEEAAVFASDPEALELVKLVPKNQGIPKFQENDEDEEDEEDGIFASDPEALKYIQLGPNSATTVKSSNVERRTLMKQDTSKSDPEPTKFIKLVPKNQESSKPQKDEDEEDEEGIFASDPEALKYIQLGPNSAAPVKSSKVEERKQDTSKWTDSGPTKFIKLVPKNQQSSKPQKDEEEEDDGGIFASDPEALKYVRFGHNPGKAGASNIQESGEGIFASDPEAMKFVKVAQKNEEGSSKASTENEGAVASDPAALNGTPLAHQRADSASAEGASTVSKTTAQEGEGDLLAEATNIELKDSRAYSVKVCGHDLPNGQLKKFVTVRSTDPQGGPTREEIDNMDVSVETKVGEDGLVEKFVVVE